MLKGPLKVLWVPPLLSQGHPELGAQDHLQKLLNIEEETPPNLSGHPVPVLYHHVAQKCFLVLQFVLCAFCAVTGHCWGEPSSVLVVPYLQVFMDIDEIPLSLLLFRLRNLSSSVSAHRRGTPGPLAPYWLCVGLFPVCPGLSCSEPPSTSRGTPGAVSPVLGSVKRSPFFLTYWYTLPKAAKNAINLARTSISSVHLGIYQDS